MNKSLTIPVLIITVGIAWLLNTYHVLPGVDWVWTLGLAIVGILVLLCGKLHKLKFVVGAFLLIATIFSLLRQTGRLTVDIEIPGLTIAFGVLLLIAQLSGMSTPEWLKNEPSDKKPGI